MALAFSDLLYKKEHPEAKYSKSPGAAQKVLRKTSGATAPETAGEESDGGVSAIQTGPAGGGSVQEHQAQETAQVEEAPAMIVSFWGEGERESILTGTTLILYNTIIAYPSPPPSYTSPLSPTLMIITTDSKEAN